MIRMTPRSVFSPKFSTIAIPFALVTALLTALNGCGDQAASPPPASEQCPKGQALVGLSESGLTALCGCAENGSTTLAPSQFTCTVTAPSNVTFQLMGIGTAKPGIDHQIVFESRNLPASPVLNSDDLRTHSIRVESAGSYPFTDRGSRGRIRAL